MSKQVEATAIESIPLDQLNSYTSNANVTSVLTEKNLLTECVEGSDRRAKLQATLNGIDRSMTWNVFASEYKEYFPEYFLSLAPQVGLTPKRPSYWNMLFPNAITVDREPYVWIGAADHSDPKKQARWQFVTKSNRLDQKTSTYALKSAGLREFGHAAAWFNNDLSDTPLSVIENHMQKMANKLTVFLNDWAIAEMYDATSGANAATYSNVFTCEGTKTAYTPAVGDAKTTTHGISADDLLQAINEFRTGEGENGIDDPLTRGVDYYIPTVLAISPSVKRQLAMELYRMGYRMTGNDGAAPGVRQSALLSDFFEVPIVVINPKKWDAKHAEFEADDSAYLIDTDFLATVNHSDGWKQVQWNDNADDKTIISVRKRGDFLVQDNLAVMRLEPAA